MLDGQSRAGVAVAVAGLRAAVEEPMVIYGLFLFVLANLLKMSFLSWLGFIFVIIGGVFSISGYFGHPVGGRRNWY